MALFDFLTSFDNEAAAHDGDTFIDRESGESLRINGINTPESNQAGASEALATARRFEGAETDLTGDRGFFGRLLGDKVNSNGNRLSNELLARGQAEIFGTTATNQQRAIRNDLNLSRSFAGGGTVQQQADLKALDSRRGAFIDQLDSSRDSRRSLVKVKRDFKTDAVSRGVDQVQQMAFGLTKLFGDSIDSETISKWAKNGIDQQAVDIFLNPRATKSFTQSDGFSDSVESLFESLLEQVPNIGVTIGTSLATGGLGALATRGAVTALAKREALETAVLQQTLKEATSQIGRQGIANEIKETAASFVAKKATASGFATGQKVGAGVASFALNTGETKISFDAEGIDNNSKVFFTGLVKSALDFGGLSQIPGVNKLVGFAGRKSGKSITESMNLLVKVPFDVAKAAVTEGTTEGLQTVLDKVAINDSLGRDWSQADTDEVIEAGVVGAFTGGTIGTPGAIIQNVGKNTELDSDAAQAESLQAQAQQILDDLPGPESDTGVQISEEFQNKRQAEKKAERAASELQTTEALDQTADDSLPDAPLEGTTVTEPAVHNTADLNAVEEQVALSKIIKAAEEGGTVPESPKTLEAQQKSVASFTRPATWQSKNVKVTNGAAEINEGSNVSTTDSSGADVVLTAVHVKTKSQSGIMYFLKKADAEAYVQRLNEAEIQNPNIDNVDVINNDFLYTESAKPKSELKPDTTELVSVIATTDKDENGKPVVISSVLVDDTNKKAVLEETKKRFRRTTKSTDEDGNKIVTPNFIVRSSKEAILNEQLGRIDNVEASDSEVQKQVTDSVEGVVATSKRNQRRIARDREKGEAAIADNNKRIKRLQKGKQTKGTKNRIQRLTAANATIQERQLQFEGSIFDSEGLNEEFAFEASKSAKENTRKAKFKAESNSKQNKNDTSPGTQGRFDLIPFAKSEKISGGVSSTDINNKKTKTKNPKVSIFTIENTKAPSNTSTRDTSDLPFNTFVENQKKLLKVIRVKLLQRISEFEKTLSTATSKTAKVSIASDIERTQKVLKAINKHTKKTTRPGDSLFPQEAAVAIDSLLQGQVAAREVASQSDAHRKVVQRIINRTEEELSTDESLNITLPVDADRKVIGKTSKEQLDNRQKALDKKAQQKKKIKKQKENSKTSETDKALRREFRIKSIRDTANKIETRIRELTAQIDVRSRRGRNSLSTKQVRNARFKQSDIDVRVAETQKLKDARTKLRQEMLKFRKAVSDAEGGSLGESALVGVSDQALSFTDTELLPEINSGESSEVSSTVDSTVATLDTTERLNIINKLNKLRKKFNLQAFDTPPGKFDSDGKFVGFFDEAMEFIYQQSLKTNPAFAQNLEGFSTEAQELLQSLAKLHTQESEAIIQDAGVSTKDLTNAGIALGVETVGVTSPLNNESSAQEQILNKENIKETDVADKDAEVPSLDNRTNRASTTRDSSQRTKGPRDTQAKPSEVSSRAASKIEADKGIPLARGVFAKFQEAISEKIRKSIRETGEGFLSKNDILDALKGLNISTPGMRALVNLFRGLPDDLLVVVNSKLKQAGVFDIGAEKILIKEYGTQQGGITILHELVHAVSHAPARLADMAALKGLDAMVKLAKAAGVPIETINAAEDIFNVWTELQSKLPESVGDVATPSELTAVVLSDPLAMKIANDNSVTAEQKSALTSAISRVLKALSKLLGFNKGSALERLYAAVLNVQDAKKSEANRVAIDSAVSSVENTIFEGRSRTQMNRIITPRGSLKVKKIAESIGKVFSKNTAKGLYEGGKSFINPILSSASRLKKVSKKLAEGTAAWYGKYQSEHAILNNRYDELVTFKFSKVDVETGFAEVLANNVQSDSAKAIQQFLIEVDNAAEIGASAFVKAKARLNKGKFPFVPNVSAISQNREDFIVFILENDFTITRGDKQVPIDGDLDLVEQIVDNIIGFRPGDGFQTKPGSGFRDFIITDPKFGPAAFEAGWTHTDPVTVLTQHVDSIIRFKSFDRQWGGFENALGKKGALTGRQYLDSLGFDIEKMSPARSDRILETMRLEGRINIKDDGTVQVWTSDLGQEQALFEASQAGQSEVEGRKVVAGILGNLGRDLNPAVRKSMQWAVVAQSYFILAFSTISSIPEIGVMLGLTASKSPKAAFKGLSTFAKSVTDIASQINKGVPIKEVRNRSLQLSRTIGTITNSIASVAYSDIHNFDLDGNKPKAAMEKLFKYNGNTIFADINRAIATEISIEYFQDLAAKNDTAGLKRWGVTPAEVKVWTANKNTLFMQDPTGDSQQARTVSKVNSAFLKFVDSHVARPTAIQKAVFGNDPRFMLLSQLKGFYYSYAASIIPEIGRTMAETYNNATAANKPKVLAGLQAALPLIITAGAAMPLAILAREIKAAIRDTDDDQDRIRKGQGAFEQYSDIIRNTGLLGPLDLLLGIYDAEQYDQSIFARAMGPTAGHLDVLLSKGPFSPEFVQRTLPILGTIHPQIWKEWKRKARKERRAEKRKRQGR